MTSFRNPASGAALAALSLAACVSLTGATAGCLPFWLFDDDDEPPDAEPRMEQPRSNPPSIDTISVADWPPIGPNGAVTVHVTDDRALESVELQFLHHVVREAYGTAATVSVSGSELGEGMGTLTIRATDTEGGEATRWVESLLVDLSPPKAQLGTTVLRAGGDGETEGSALELWVGDAWVLGSVELSFAGETRSKAFPPGFPPTLGTAWDYSLVKFPTADLPEGSGTAELRVWDAAGNLRLETFDLVIDGVAPEVSVLSPEPNATVSGDLTVEVLAGDPGGGPVWIELSLGGTHIATSPGPVLSVQIDAEELLPGEAELVAVAVDAAGNRSEPLSVPVVLE